MSSNKYKFKLDLSGLNELMKSSEMKAHLQQAGEAVASAAGGDCGVNVHTANYVAIANVYPNTKESASRNYKENTLLKALGTAGLKSHK